MDIRISAMEPADVTCVRPCGYTGWAIHGDWPRIEIGSMPSFGGMRPAARVGAIDRAELAPGTNE